jgi:hypothetical protein
VVAAAPCAGGELVAYALWPSRERWIEAGAQPSANLEAK